MYLHVDTSLDAMTTRNLHLRLTVAKWGNSLAVRLPALACHVAVDQLSAEELVEVRHTGTLPDWFFDAVEAERSSLNRPRR